MLDDLHEGRSLDLVVRRDGFVVGVARPRRRESAVQLPAGAVRRNGAVGIELQLRDVSCSVNS